MNITKNPWLPESLNLDTQARLVKSDPARARILKAAAAGVGSDINPWLPETRNLSAQAALTRSDPERAKILKAAAKAGK